MRTRNKCIRTLCLIICMLTLMVAIAVSMSISTKAYGTTYGGWISTNTTYSVSLNSSQAAFKYFFTAPYSGTYRFSSWSKSGSDPYGLISEKADENNVHQQLVNTGRGRDSTSYTIAYNDDGNGELNFLGYVYLKAGQDYAFFASKYGADTAVSYYFSVDFYSYYSVSLNGNGATSAGTTNLYGGYPASNTTYYSTHISNAPTSYISKPTKTGYQFAGYNTDSGVQVIQPSGYINNTTLDDYGNCTIYAQWTPNYYYFAFNGNGANSGSMPTQTFRYGTRQNITANAYQRTGYTFLGWSRSSTATSPTWTNGQSVSNYTSGNGSTYTLYAVWQANSYNVNYNGNGGTGSMSATTHTYNSAAYLSQNTYTRPGYTFLGWSTNSSATTPTYSNRAWVSNLSTGSNVTLYAVWRANTYTVTFNDQAATTAGTPNIAVDYDNTMPAIALPRKTGYTFSGYYESPNGVGQKYYNSNGSSANNYNIVGPTTLYANWAANTYNIGVDLDGGTLAEIPTSGTYNSPITLGIPEKENSLFVGWQVAGAGYNAATAYYTLGDATATSITNGITPDFTQYDEGVTNISLYNLSASIGGNVTVTALWINDAFPVAFRDSDNSVISVTRTRSVEDFIVYTYGQAVTVPADPTKADDATYHYVFAGWKSSKTGEILSGAEVEAIYAGAYIDESVYEVVYTAVYNVTYLKEIHLAGVAQTLTITPNQSVITFDTQFKITRNTGVNSLLLLLDFDTDAFELNNITVNGSNGESLVLNGFKWTLTGAEVPSNYQYVLLEGLNETAPYFNNSVSDEVFLTLNFTSKVGASGGQYNFGFITDYPESTDELPESPRSEAYYIYAVEEGVSQQGEVRITVDSSLINIIIQATGEVTIDENQSKLYNGIAVTASDVQAALLGDILYSYNGFGDPAAIVTVKWYNSEGAELLQAPINAGSYKIGVAVSNGTYYSAVDEVIQNFVITPVILSYTSDDLSAQDKVYNGQGQSWILAELGALPEHTSFVSVSGTYTDVDTHTLTVILRADTNYSFAGENGDTLSFSVPANITKAINRWTSTLESSYPEASDSFNKTYDTYGINASADAQFGETIIQYSVDGENWGTNNFTDAGSYFVRAMVEDTVNYSGLESVLAYVIARQAFPHEGYETDEQWLQAVLTGADKVYNASVQTWIITDITNVPVYTSITGVDAIAEQDYTNVGMPDISVSLHVTNANYCFANNAEDITVTIEVEITPYTLHVTASNQSAIYSGAEPYATDEHGNSTGKIAQLYNISIAGDEEVPQFVYNDGLGIELIKEAGVNVGEYDITITTDNSNYIFTTTAATFTITKAFVGLPTINPFIYNGTIQIPVVPENALYSFSATGEVNAGTYGIIVTLTDTTNYAWTGVQSTPAANFDALTEYYESGSNGYYKVDINAFAENALYYTYVDSQMQYVKAYEYDAGTAYFIRNGQNYTSAGEVSEAQFNGYYTMAGEFDADTEYFTFDGENYISAGDITEFANETQYFVYVEPMDCYVYTEVDIYATVEHSGINEYADAAVNLDWTILPAAVTVTIDNKESQYTDAIVELTGSVTDGTVYGEDNLNLSYTTTATNTSVVNTYPITGEWVNDNYIVTFVDGIYEITKKTVGGGTAQEPDFLEIIAQINAVDKPYTGSEIVWLLNDFSTDDDIITLDSVAAQNGVNYIHVKTDDSKYYYNVTIGLADDDNYIFINDSATQVLEVEVIIIRATNIWTEGPTAAATDVSNVETSATALFGTHSIAYYDDISCETPHVGDYTAGITYYAKFSVEGNTDYTGLDKVVSFRVGYYTISKPTVTYEQAAVENYLKTIIYDGLTHGFTIPSNVGYTVTLTAGEWKNVSTYTATIALAGNYTWEDESITDVVYTLIIYKAALAITADNKSVTYLDAVPGYTVSTDAFVNGESFITYQDPFDIGDYINCTYTATSPVNTYDIVFSENAEASLEAILTNYDVTLTNGILTVSKIDYDDDDPENEHRWNVAISNLTVEYDSLSHSIVISGDKPDNINVTYTIDAVAGNSAINVKRVANTVAAYVITATFDVTGEDAANYEIPNPIVANLTINPVELTIKADNQNATYTGLEPVVNQNEFTFEWTNIEHAGTPGIDGYAFIATEITGITITKAAGVNVGTYTLTPGVSTNNNYNLTLVNGEFSITIATNSWTTELWVRDNIIYDGEIVTKPDDYNAVSLFGTPVFRFYDNEGVELQSAPVNAGTYYIVAEVAATTNYLGLTAGLGEEDVKTKALVISKATYNMEGITFVDKSVTYNATTHTVIINGTLPVGVTVNYTSNSRKNAGSQTATASFTFSDTVNYNAIENMEAELEVLPAAITLTAEDKTSQYYQDLEPLTFVVSVGTNYNNEIVPSLVTTATNRSPAGDHDITITASHINYIITVEDSTYTITQATTNTVEITASDVEYLHELIYSATSTFGTVVYTFSTDGETYAADIPTDVDSYWVKATVVETTDYIGGEDIATFEITKATLADVVFTYNYNTASWSVVTKTTTNMTVDCTVTYTVGDVEGGTPNENRQITATAADVYYVNAISDDPDNYNNSRTATANAYSVTFSDMATDPAHGEVTGIPETQYVFHGQEAVAPQSAPTTDGYTFVYWKVGQNGTQYYFATPVTANIGLYIEWQIKTFTITWNLYGNISTETYNYKAMPSFKGSTARPEDDMYSYTFNRWNPTIVAVVEDATYTALYNTVGKSYTITFYLAVDDGDYTVFGESITIAYGDGYNSPVIPAIDWFRADAWYTDTERTTEAPETLSTAANINLYGAYMFDIGLGDVNADGLVTADDITLYRQRIVGGYNITIITAGTEYDLITGGTYNEMEHYYLERVADVNNDRNSDIRDISTIRMAIVGGHGYDVLNEAGGITGEEVGTIAVAAQTDYTVVVSEEVDNLSAAVNGNTIAFTSTADIIVGSSVTITITAPNYYLISEGIMSIEKPDDVNGVITGNSYVMTVEISESSETYKTITIDWDGAGTRFNAQTYTIDTSRVVFATY